MALQQVTTGLRVNQPSDDPGAAATMTISLASSANVDQYTANISSVTSQMQTADSSFSAIVTSLNTAVTLGTSGAGGTVSTANKQAIATELEGVLSSVVAQGNASYQGVYLFAGSASSTLPLVPASTTYTSLAGTVALPLTAAYPLTAGSVTSVSDASTGKTFVFTASAGATLSQLSTAVANAAAAGTLSAGTTASINATGQLSISSNSNSDGIVVTTNDPALGAMNATPGTEVANSYAYVGNSHRKQRASGRFTECRDQRSWQSVVYFGGKRSRLTERPHHCPAEWDERANPNRDHRRFHILEQCYPATRSPGQQHQPVELSGELPEPGNTDADHPADCAGRSQPGDVSYQSRPGGDREQRRAGCCRESPAPNPAHLPLTGIILKSGPPFEFNRGSTNGLQWLSATVNVRIRPDLLHLLPLALS